MTEPGFVHLHTHTEYSLLDGAARIEAPKSNPSAPTIFTEAVAHGMPALAMTDHGAMFGTLKFYAAARAVGVKPIIGVEAYVAPGSRFDCNPGESEEKYYHLTLLARNETGYRNLLKLVSQAYLEGFYHRPRMDKQLLAEHAEGIICLSGCLSSEIGVQLLAGQHERALAVAGEYRDIFGADGYFIEMQDHGLADQRAILAKQVQLARDIAVPVVATNDLHYTRPDDAKPHDVLLCIQQQKLQSDPKRLKFDSEDFYLKSAAEMRRVFAELPEACDQTLEIASTHRAAPRARACAGRRCDRVSAAAIRNPGRRTAGQLPARAGRARGRGPLRATHPGRGDRPHRPRAVDHLEDGVLRVLPDRVGPHPLRARAGHPRGPGAGIGGRIGRVVLRCGSPISIHCATGCCSSDSSIPTASRCPTSTWTSTSAVATR